VRPPPGRGSRLYYALLLPGLFGIVFASGSRSRGARLLSLIVVLGVSTLGLSSCGGSSSGVQKMRERRWNYAIGCNATTRPDPAHRVSHGKPYRYAIAAKESSAPHFAGRPVFPRKRPGQLDWPHRNYWRCPLVQTGLQWHLRACTPTSTIKLFSLASFPRRPSAPQAVPGGATDPTTDNRRKTFIFFFAKRDVLPRAVDSSRANDYVSPICSSAWNVLSGRHSQPRAESIRAGKEAGAPTLSEPAATNGDVTGNN